MHSLSHSSQRLVRPRDGYLAGVCQGLGVHFGIAPTWFRLAWLVAVLIFGTGLLLYALLWWLMPHADRVPVEPTVWNTGENGRRQPPFQRTLYDRKLAGVCGGLARRWGIDPTLLRLSALLLFTASGGLAIIVYGIAAVLMDGPVAQLEPHPVQL